LIYRQDDFVVHENWRRPETVEHIERSEWQPPTLLTGAVERDQPKLLKENVDIRTVRYRTRRRRVIYILQTAHTRPRHLSLPKRFSCVTVESYDQQFVVFFLNWTFLQSAMSVSLEPRGVLSAVCRLLFDYFVRRNKDPIAR
jgi:hypothetical protein